MVALVRQLLSSQSLDILQAVPPRVDITPIDARLRYLDRQLAIRPYERKKEALLVEFEAFLSRLPTPCSLDPPAHKTSGVSWWRKTRLEGQKLMRQAACTWGSTEYKGALDSKDWLPEWSRSSSGI